MGYSDEETLEPILCTNDDSNEHTCEGRDKTGRLDILNDYAKCAFLAADALVEEGNKAKQCPSVPV
jgi:hypothetical protein